MRSNFNYIAKVLLIETLHTKKFRENKEEMCKEGLRKLDEMNF